MKISGGLQDTAFVVFKMKVNKYRRCVSKAINEGRASMDYNGLLFRCKELSIRFLSYQKERCKRFLFMDWTRLQYRCFLWKRILTGSCACGGFLGGCGNMLQFWALVYLFKLFGHLLLLNNC